LLTPASLARLSGSRWLLLLLLLPAALSPWAWVGTGPIAAVGLAAGGLLVAAGVRARSAKLPEAVRLNLLERRALGTGGELWLVEVDGRTVLVACGRGFAAIRPLRPGGPA
jgi:hypothetical protein